MDVERDLGRPLDVLLSDHGGVIPQVVAVPVAMVVVVAGQLVEQLAAVVESPQLEDQHPGPLPVDQQHTESLIPLEHGLELQHVRCLVDDQLVAHRYTKVDHFEEIVGEATEQGQPSRLRPVEPTLDVCLEPPEIPLGRAGTGASSLASLRRCSSCAS